MQKHFFGVEIEFADAYIDDVYNSLNELSLSAPLKYSRESYQPLSDGNSWHLKYDLSVCDTHNGKRTGGELATPAMTPSTKSFDEIAKCINAILASDSEPVFHDGTGLHIHIDINDIDRFTFLTIWTALEADIFRLFPARRNNWHAQSLHRITTNSVKKTVRARLAAIFANKRTEDLFGGKQSALKFYKRNERDFLEIRVGQMSDDVLKIIAWIKLCLQMVEYAKRYKDVFELFTFQEIKTFRKLNQIADSHLKLTKPELTAVLG